MKTPEPFGRILGALQPDVVLIQEWDGASADELQDWFDRHASLAYGFGVES